MADRKYFGTDGIRGRVGTEPISPETVLRLGWAAGCVLGRGPGSKILIGNSGRGDKDMPTLTKYPARIRSHAGA